MQPAISKAIYNGLSDSLHCAIDTGNQEEADLVLLSAREALERKEIIAEQLAELVADHNQAF